ncbi:coumaroyl-CoA:anthocyanidin 3-O-glucoside-6''-O-coumaroyltransferase 1 [Cajanus cajan]|uniref:Anthocyanin 5-aromatic acyltransferase n=1 Tax=Cajanus cajan TaxID=3821 RepID=A0A151QXZ8_CAJCA|nr:coumaroyl-CoA:anthocyanidin 3-O-glucoside-6''-O-coumaroyltransferase 1 [Cajanus cajan]KYP35190.1 Anthocyanin 5-aromatic acyltransferase [Cajanus cajan]
MAVLREHKLVETCRVGPAVTTTTSLPLTFLDLPLAAGPVYVRRQFFYHFPHSTLHFCETTLPSLKTSLSHTLQHFFPLAGNLLCPPPPHKPFIRCTDHDSLTLTIIESKDDFNHTSSNHPKTLKDLDHLVPKLTYTYTHDDTFTFPLVALQATVFPNHGLCIAITYCHVMDDRCCSHFMKSWSSICRSRGVDLTLVEKFPPCFDREVLKDPKGLEAIFLRDYFEDRSTWKDKLVGKKTTTSEISTGNNEDYAKATIVFGRDDIEGLKRWVLNEWNKSEELKAPQYVSTFVVTCAFVWSCLVKTRCRNDDGDNEKEEYFRFAADCRDRLEYPVPETYFGNCLTFCYSMLKREDLKGEGDFVNAVKVIARAVTDMKSKLFKDAENWRESFMKMFVLGSTLVVTGSPKFTVYETDFGFGRPKKVEMIHSFKGMSLAESGDREGGLEVGLVCRTEEFEYLFSVIQQGLHVSKS